MHTLYAGESQGEIARTMGVAKSTVVDHVRKLYRALDVSGLHELRDLLGPTPDRRHTLTRAATGS
jgi:DNA-binding NarL/FixJ family response regulator